MYKMLNSLSPDIMKDIFKTTTNYYDNLNALIFSKKIVTPIKYELQTMSYMSPKI